MRYWLLLILLFVVIIAIGVYIWKKTIRDNNIENSDLALMIILGCMTLAGFIILSIDIPSAICGGQEMYVDELPTVEHWGTHISFIKTDNEELKHLKLADWERYEKYGHYRIRYTKLNKCVLEIEKID